MKRNGKPPEVEDLRGPMREMREYTRGNLDVDHEDALYHSGLIQDEETRRLLTFLTQVYEPGDGMPQNFFETELGRIIIEQEATETAAKAVFSGDPNRAAFMTGIPSYKADLSRLHGVNGLEEFLLESEQCMVIYLAALMGRGKTDLALLFLQIVDRYYTRARSSLKSSGFDDEAQKVPSPEFATNFKIDVPRGVEWQLIDNYPDLKAWMEDPNYSNEDVRWFVFDEASSELTGQTGKSQEVTDRMGSLVKKMRKFGVNLVVIGHDGRDVVPAIRSVAKFISKGSLKTMQIFEGINKRKPVGHVMDIRGIPPTRWGFDTNDTANWSWGEEAEEDLYTEEEVKAFIQDELKDQRDRRMSIMYRETDLSYEDVGQIFGVSGDTARRADKGQPDQNVAQSGGAQEAVVGD